MYIILLLITILVAFVLYVNSQQIAQLAPIAAPNDPIVIPQPPPQACIEDGNCADGFICVNMACTVKPNPMVDIIKSIADIYTSIDSKVSTYTNTIASINTKVHSDDAIESLMNLRIGVRNSDITAENNATIIGNNIRSNLLYITDAITSLNKFIDASKSNQLLSIITDLRSFNLSLSSLLQKLQ